MVDKLNSFLKKSKIIHGIIYDYSHALYVNAHTKLIIICPIHGEFLMKPNNHTSGKQGCPRCSILKRKQNKPKLIENFIRDCKLIHNNKYDYSLVNYINNNTKVKIKCNLCEGLFNQTPNAHLSGQGCPICNKNHKKSVHDYVYDTKICKKCNIQKNINNFYKYQSKNNFKYYFHPVCKDCQKKLKVEYRKNPINQKRRRKYEKNYTNKRRLIDPPFKLKKDFSSIIRRVLKGNKNNYSLWNFLPYKPNELKFHLEKQFDKNMSWSNHGTYWHIDHIKPQIMLPYDSMSHPNFLICWSLDNLRPLKIEDNLHKSSIFNGINYKNKTNA